MIILCESEMNCCSSGQTPDPTQLINIKHLCGNHGKQTLTMSISRLQQICFSRRENLGIVAVWIQRFLTKVDRRRTDKIFSDTGEISYCPTAIGHLPIITDIC